MRKEDVLIRPDRSLSHRLLSALKLRHEQPSAEEATWQAVVDQALEGKTERARAQAVRQLARAPLGLINSELFLDLIEKESAFSIREAAAKTALKRLEASKRPTEFAFMGKRLAQAYLAEKNPQVRKLIDYLFNEIHFAILSHLEENEAFGKKDELFKEPGVAAFASTRPSVERKTYDGKYEAFLKKV